VRAVAIAALAALAGCSGGGGKRAEGGDTIELVGPQPAGISHPGRSAVEAIPVNRGTQGMRAAVRWVLSPDRRAILVVEDAVSVEAEALPDGFLYASEVTGTIVQIDSVWDVAPSPDWTRVAFGRAYVLRAGESDVVPESEWRRLEAQLPEDVTARDTRSLRRVLQSHAFPASGMSVALGLGLTQVLFLDRLGPGRLAASRAPTHSVNGWRVRWTRRGDTLAVGAAPRAVQDDAPPARWTHVRPRLWAVYTDTLGGTTDTSAFAAVAWTEGPTMERGTPLELSEGQPITIAGGTIDSRGGTIRMSWRGRDGRPQVRVIGPGLALAATASGRFMVALVPRAATEEGDMQAQTVVYHIPPE
jgi:hypothetical protein